MNFHQSTLRAVVRDAIDDLTHARRILARRPLALCTSVAGLALGLGVSTAALTILNAAILRGEGLIDADRVPAVIRTTPRSASTTWRLDEFLRLREGATGVRLDAVLTDTAPAHATPPDPAGARGVETRVAFVSGGFFQSTGARIVKGRALEPADEGAANVVPVVVSHAFWISALSSDPGVLSRIIHVGRTTATIVGVAAPGFVLPHDRALWLPVTAYRAVYDGTLDARVPAIDVEVFARLLPQSTLGEAEAQLSGVAAGLPREGSDGEVVQARLRTDAGLGRSAWGDVLIATALVFAAITIVLLLSWGNVASVLVATAIVREREIGVRLALGARRGRIVRQLAVEGLALACAGALVGLAGARLAMPWIGAAIDAPSGADLTPDTFVLACLGVLTLAVGLAAGIAPVRHILDVDVNASLKGDGARAGRPTSGRMRATLVVVQSAASILLVVLAALFVRASINASTVDPGFEAEGLYAASPPIGSAAADPASAAAVRRRTMAELEVVPGVRGVSLAEFAPFGDETRTAITGRGRDGVEVHFNRVRAEYFALLGLHLLHGRVFTADELAGGAPVALVSHSVARAFWPDRSPLGEPLSRQIPVAGTRPIVIGVVSDAVTARLHEQNTLVVYEPLAPAAEAQAVLLLRVDPRMAGVLQQAGQRLASNTADANGRLESVADRLRTEARTPMMLATLAVGLGLSALTLCVIGLYGLTSTVVGQRMHEMAVRMAVGASPGALWRLVGWQSLRPVVIGLVVGGATALGSGHLIAAVFFGISSRDPIAFLTAAALVVAAALLAVMPAAQRAAAADPATLLRRS